MTQHISDENAQSIVQKKIIFMCISDTHVAKRRHIRKEQLELLHLVFFVRLIGCILVEKLHKMILVLILFHLEFAQSLKPNNKLVQEIKLEMRLEVVLDFLLVLMSLEKKLGLLL